MIELKNVSKFYYKKGMIASGITRVNLEFSMGEFVVITGESGSGKSTLLNVISGLDSYEEGEMYIEGKETSHYNAQDFEEYRKKYIGNIFQSFNLVSSYTVYQNIELILLIEGKKKEEVKDRIDEMIDKVGLTEFRNTKVSKLSGGQKQRVAIARALAKDVPIIVADEPTGNLDQKSAEDVIRLLAELSKDRLVFVVTHNYDQFAEHATRRIKLNDGKVTEDTVIRETADLGDPDPEKFNRGNITGGNKMLLGARNTFNILPKFLLLLFVFIFMITAISANYAGRRADNAKMNELFSSNQFFPNLQSDRIIVKRPDGQPLTDEDYKKLEKTTGVKTLVKNDIALDCELTIEGSSETFVACPVSRTSMPKKVDIGRLPEADDEVLLKGPKWQLDPDEKALKASVGQDFKLYTSGNIPMPCKVVGIKYDDNLKVNSAYCSDPYMAAIANRALQDVTNIEITINGKVQAPGTYPVEANANVPSGKVYVPEEVGMLYDDGTGKGKAIKIKYNNIFFQDEKEYKIAENYTKKNYKKLLGSDKDFDEINGPIYMSQADSDAVFNRPNYQSSVFVKDVDKVSATVKALNKEGYRTLDLKRANATQTDTTLFKLISAPFSILEVIIIFFICYFVIKLILKSRGTYFSILRLLGMNKKDIKTILDIELFIVANIAAAVVVAGFNAAVKFMDTPPDFITNLFKYLRPTDDAVLYVIIILMSFLLSRRFSTSLFRKSAMSTFRGEE